MSKRTSLVFFGAGPVALASLKFLHEHFEIEAVISKPNPRSSRAPRHVPEWAEAQGLTLHQPDGKAALKSLVADANFSSSVGVVVDFGVIIPEETINTFEFGILNSHFSILPQWRGADPLTFSLLSGQPTTGVSVMQIVPALDEGDLLGQEPYTITKDETIASLTDNLIDLSNQMLLQLIPAYVAGDITPYPQSAEGVSYSRKLDKSDGEIDWNKPAEVIEREIRAFKGWPGSYTEIFGKRSIITEAYTTPVDSPDMQAGQFEAVKDAGIIGVQTGSGTLWIKKLKPQGKGEMDAAAFMNGYLR